MYKWYQSKLALFFRSFDLRVDSWPMLSWKTVTLLWSHLTLMGTTILIRKWGWKHSWNLLMRKLGTSLNMDGRSPLLQLVCGKLLRKKQPLLIAKLWMLFLMLFLWIQENLKCWDCSHYMEYSPNCAWRHKGNQDH